MNKKARLIAIGDIHGELEKLNKLLKKLELTGKDTVVFLGDYIDRGRNSKEVVNTVKKLSDTCKCIYLMGNHEYFLLKTIDGDEDAKYFFMTYGGVETLESYGGTMEELIETHYDFYLKLKPYYKTDKYIFVHGGIKPNCRLEKQNLYEMLMIRDEFINNPTNLEQKVIFGHTPFDKPLIKEDKIGIDTGCGKFDDAPLTAYICNENKFVSVN